MTIDIDFLRTLDRLQLILKKKIYADTQGGHTSTSFGEGVVFQDYKAYVPGDDFRHIDWKVYARTDKFYIRRFEEERNMTIHILIDASASMDFGSGPHNKFDYASMVGLGFSYMAYRNNERFLVNTFTDKVRYVRPGKGRDQLVSFFDYLRQHKAVGKSDFKRAMEEYRKRINSKSMIILISDFLYDLDEVREVLARYRKSEVFVIQVLDIEERNLSVSGDIILEDSETETKMRTFISHRMKQNYQDKLQEHIYHLKDLCEENDASFISVSTNTPIFETFYHMLK